MLDKILYRGGRCIVAGYARLMFDLDIAQRVPLPPGPKIIAANHPTTTDPFLLTLLEPDHMSILIHKTLFDVPLFGPYLERAGHLSVNQERGRAAFDRAARILSEGHTIGIFPEGDVSPDHGGFHPPHTGAIRLALGAGVPIIPVGIDLDRNRIRRIETKVKGEIEVGNWYTHGAYAMTVDAPLQFNGEVSDRAHVRAASEELMQRIEQLARQSARRLSASTIPWQERSSWLGMLTARVAGLIWAFPSM